MATSLLKFSFKTGLVKSIISEISSNIGKYYYMFGKSDPWFSITGLTATLVANSNTVVLASGSTSGFLQGQTVTQSGGAGSFGTSAKIESIQSSTAFTVTVAHAVSGGVVFSIDDESIVEPAIDSYEYETQVRNNALLYKQIDVNDVSPVVLRQNWQAGFVFDMYREYTEEDPSFNGATSLQSSLFYVVTDEYRVYKCLDNYNNSPSQNKPTSTSPVPFQTDDLYIWKYMYTIPITLRNKFLSNTLMPVTTSLTTQFYSKGAIVGYSIADPGAGYVNGSYKVTGFRILSGGAAYIGTPTITIQAPHQAGGTQAVVGTITVTNGAITSILMSSVGSGYSYPPTFTLTGAATTGAIIEPIIALVSSGGSYTSLEVDGDGVLEESPYVLDSFEIINGGSGYASITLLFTDPDLPNGVKAVATVSVNGAGTVTSITKTQEGYGYSNIFKSVFEDPNSANVVRYTQTNLTGTPGSGFQFRVITKKNNAVLSAIVNANGQIQEVKVIKPGIGYTYASCNVVTDFDTTQQAGFKPASILLDFGIGAIETNQSTVEITAVPGAIYAIHVKNSGVGYAEAPAIAIVGDGIGAVATGVINAFGRLEKVNIINPGSGYTVATAVLTGIATENAEVDVILPPKNGHGSDAISELFTKTIMFRTSLFKDTIDRQPINNSFRQVSLVRNPRNYNSNTNLRLGVATSCILAIGSNTQSTDFNKIYVNDILTNNGSRFLVVAKYPNYSTTSYGILLNYLDNKVITSGSTLIKPAIGGSGASFSVGEIVAPTVNKYSGELLTLENKVKFTPSTEQIVVASNTITF